MGTGEEEARARGQHFEKHNLAEIQAWIITNLKGASPVPGPTIRIGVLRSAGSLKSGFFEMKAKTLSPRASRSDT